MGLLLSIWYTPLLSYTLIWEAANFVLTSTFSIPRLLRWLGDEEAGEGAGEGESEAEAEDGVEEKDESEVEGEVVGRLHGSCKERNVSDNSKAVIFKF